MSAAVRARVPLVCVAGPLLLGLVSLVLQAPSGPVLFADEIAYLGIGVHLSARDAVVQLGELEFYSPGYGIVLAPLLSVIPADPWVVAVGLNLLCLGALGPLLFLLLREVTDLTRHRAGIAATVAASTPAVLLQVTRAWPEVLLAVLVALWALLLARSVGRDPAGAWGLAAAAVAAAAMTTHRRAVVLVAITAVVLVQHHLASARGRSSSRRRGLAWLGAALALLTAHHVANAALDRSIKDRLYPGSDLVDATERAAELARSDLASQLVGHGWAALHATFGLALLGAVATVALLWPGPHRRFGIALAATLGGAIAVSAVAVADGPRVDHLLYERYVAPVAVVVVALGLAFLVDDRRRIALRWALVVPAATAALVLVADGSRFEGGVQKLTSPTVAALEHVVRWEATAFLDGIHPWRISVLVTLVAAVALGTRRRGGLAAVAVVAATFSVVVVVASTVALRPFVDRWEDYASPLAAAVGSDGGPIGVTVGAPEPVRAVLQYRTGHRRVVPVDEVHCPDLDEVVAEVGFEPRWAADEVVVVGEPEVRLLRPRC